MGKGNKRSIQRYQKIIKYDIDVLMMYVFTTKFNLNSRLRVITIKEQHVYGYPMKTSLNV